MNIARLSPPWLWWIQSKVEFPLLSLRWTEKFQQVCTGAGSLALGRGLVHADGGDETVYRLDRVEQRGRLGEDHGAAHHRRRPEHPQEHPV